MRFKITTLIEDNPSDDGLLYNEHGLSLLIECDGLKILFDTGKSGKFLENAQKLKVDLKDLDYVILSHGHYDHSGGIRTLFDRVPTNFKLILGEGFFNQKYKFKEPDKYRFIGNNFDETYLNGKNIDYEYINKDIVKITDNIMIFTNFQRRSSFENYNNDLLLKNNTTYNIDKFTDEICLGIKTKEGIFVIVGCSHVGVINILDTIHKRTGMNIYGVLGGSHLVEASEERINKTIECFKEMKVKKLAMSHCTGDLGIRKLRESFNDTFIYNNTGKMTVID